VAPRGSNRKFWKNLKVQVLNENEEFRLKKEVQSKQNGVEGGKRNIKKY
jgi:hypothetical protein